MSGLFHGSGRYGRRPQATICLLMSSAPKPEPKIRGRVPALSDDKILELRALDQFAGWDRHRLMDRYGVDAATIKRILEGLTRSRLVATRQHLPEGMENE